MRGGAAGLFPPPGPDSETARAVAREVAEQAAAGADEPARPA